MTVENRKSGFLRIGIPDKEALGGWSEASIFPGDSFAKLLENIAAPIYICDIAGRIQLYNKAAENIWGGKPGSEELLWCGPASVSHLNGEPMDPEKSSMAHAAKSGEVISGEEFVISRPDGKRSVVKSYPDPLRDNKGSVIGTINCLVDITEQKNLEEARMDSEEKVKRVVDIMPVAVYACDWEGHITFFNRKAVELWGKDPADEDEQLKYCVFHKMFLPDGTYVPPEETPMAIVLATGRSFRNLEAIAHREDGSHFIASVNIDPIKDSTGAVIGAINAFQDVTDRKRADEATQRLAAIVESSNDAIISKNLDGTITSWNAGAERIYGFSADEMIGKRISAIVPEKKRDEEEGIIERICRGERVEHYETVWQRKDKSLVEISFSVSPIKDEHGRIVGASNISRDIGRLKRIEDELRTADQRKNQFLATLAHELRGPLAPLKNALELMKLTGGGQANMDNARAIMERQVQQMGRLIDDLLDIGRITNGKMILRKSPVKITDALKNAVEACRPEVEKAGHRLKMHWEDKSAIVQADAARLTQIFSNLISNAAKYTPPGGVIEISVESRDEDAVVIVKDNGIGIPSERIGEIFDMFIQVDRSLERRTGGLGIGLTLAKQLVKMHDGSIVAKSGGAGQGSEFEVVFPLAPLKAKDLKGAGSYETAGVPLSRRVLVVDDNVDSAQSLAMMLKILGSEVQTAFDGKEAVEVAAKFSPDVIFMDIGMPKLNGFEACRNIRSQSLARPPFLVALTGWGQTEDRRKCYEAGFNMHFVKPIEMQDLISAMKVVDSATSQKKIKQ